MARVKDSDVISAWHRLIKRKDRGVINFAKFKASDVRLGSVFHSCELVNGSPWPGNHNRIYIPGNVLSCESHPRSFRFAWIVRRIVAAFSPRAVVFLFLPDLNAQKESALVTPRTRKSGGYRFDPTVEWLATDKNHVNWFRFCRRVQNRTAPHATCKFFAHLRGFHRLSRIWWVKRNAVKNNETLAYVISRFLAEVRKQQCRAWKIRKENVGLLLRIARIPCAWEYILAVWQVARYAYCVTVISRISMRSLPWISSNDKVRWSWHIFNLVSHDDSCPFRILQPHWKKGLIMIKPRWWLLSFGMK